MDELLDMLTSRIDNELFNCSIEEKTIIIISNISNKRYVIEFENLMETNLNTLIEMIYRIDKLDFLDVKFIKENTLAIGINENNKPSFLEECFLELEYSDEGIKKLETVEEVIKIMIDKSKFYRKLELEIFEDTITMNSDDWSASVNFEIDDNLKVFKSFLNGVYIESAAFYEQDYIEFSISFPELEGVFGIPQLSEIEFADDSNQDKLFFEINKISQPFFHLKTKDQEYGDEYSYDEYEENTLKIFNINSAFQIDFNSQDFYEIAQHVAKTIIFDLSYKYNIEVGLLNESEDGEDIEDSIFKLSEKIDSVKEKDMLITKLYDKDLINYYYRALQMKNSEFKYMAFYQVIECIYDEVLMATTVESIRQLISSNQFDSNIDENIKFIIDKIKLHNSSKKDEDKLKLILEKYFKGNLPDEVFLEVNKDIAELLVDMKKMSNVNELKDLQKLQKVIYRFRCDCTHSNRAYPIKKIKDENSLEDYINLIKRVAERIILNYK